MIKFIIAVIVSFLIGFSAAKFHSSASNPYLTYDV